MNKRKLGKTGIEVSEIAFGGVEIGMPYGIGVHSSADMLSKNQAVNLLHEAVDKGINFFDTARLYGESEVIMGAAFSDRRDKIVLATKCNHFKDDSSGIPNHETLKKTIETSLTESLKSLKTDYVDIFMLHQADLSILENEDVKQIFEELKTSGKIRAIGASTYSAKETKIAIGKGWDVIQLPFNLMDQTQAANFEYAQQQNVGIVVRSVLMKGILSDKGRNLLPELKMVEDHINKYKKMLTSEISEISALATKFALSFSQISSVLVGIDKSIYLEKAIQTIKGNRLSNAERELLEDLAFPNPEFLDLPLWDRLGWLK